MIYYELKNAVLDGNIMDNINETGQVKAICLSEQGIREWLWESLMVEGKMLFDIPENKSVFWGIKWYPDSVLIVAYDEDSSRIVKTHEEAYEIIKGQLTLAPSIYHSGQAGDEEKTPYCVIPTSELVAKLSTNLPSSTTHDDYTFGSSRPYNGG